MNKKELSEIRKNFSDTSDLFVLNQVATAFVDSEKNIRCQTSRAYHNIASEESDCLMATLKRVLAGTNFPKKPMKKAAVRRFSTRRYSPNWKMKLPLQR